MQLDRSKLLFEWQRANKLSKERLEMSAQLFSVHYGIWGAGGAHPGKHIRLSAEKLREWTNLPNAWIALTSYDGQLIAYAIAIRERIEGRGVVTWITQLVVHSNFRRQRIATELLQSIWGFSDHFAWGLVTSNPYTVRALEKATRRRCDPVEICSNWEVLRNFGEANVVYLKGKRSEVTPIKSIIQTDFFVDHSEMASALKNAKRDSDWKLGTLSEGQEWVAFTFREQKPFELTTNEFDVLMQDSETTVKHAYERMTLDSRHRWALHAKEEAKFLFEELKLSPDNSLLDCGCGEGRHAFEFAALGLAVTGVDQIHARIEKAKNDAKYRKSLVTFVEADCRTVLLNKTFDAGICLYDVIGSYRDSVQNEILLRNFARHIRPGGAVAISVMNFDLTRVGAIHFGRLPKDLDQLLQLRPSRTMQNTGDVFDPKYYLLDSELRVVYRKEQFDEDFRLPAEMIVSDRRYTCDELREMCRSAGLEEIMCRHVRAGAWDEALDATSPTAKEILYLGRKTHSKD